MPRIPGNLEEKLSLLSTLDERKLPYLVGDLLYFLRGHHDVKIVDGPGDGRRDVHSRLNDGELHVTQCKYHQDSSKAVSSRELDELVIALSKFGANSGLFVTNGRISPQGKREYIDNYPQFNLAYIDGSELVDHVLASPILSAIWFDGASITQVRNSVVFPFIVRVVEDDKPLAALDLSSVGDETAAISFSRATAPYLDFEPYRSPKNRTFSEHGMDYISCFEATLSGSSALFELPARFIDISQLIAQKLPKETQLAILRFGFPSLAPLVEERGRDRIRLSKLEPRSYVISSDRKIVREKQWIVPEKQENWEFPEPLSTMGSMWAGWFNRSLDTMMMLYLEQPHRGPVEYFKQIRRQHEEQWFESSLYVLGKKSNSEAMCAELCDDDQPNWSGSYGLDGLLLAWLYPNLISDELFGPGYSYNPTTDSYEVDPEFNSSQITLFRERANRIKQQLAKYDLEDVTFERANHIAAATGQVFLPEYEVFIYESPGLVHFFNETPSPTFLNGRKCVFVRMWKVNSEPAEVREKIEKSTFLLPHKADLFWDAKIGPTTMQTFITSSLILDCPPEMSTDQFLVSSSQTRDDCLDALEKQICSIWEEAVLSTRFFWTTELLFQIDGKGIRG